jgi:DNA invertase Pin-like site-specific DNA recombinase
MKIGYTRISTHHQGAESQTKQLNDAGCTRIYEDVFSGRTKERPKLNKMMDALRKGDMVIVWKLDRLGRSLKDLIEIIEQFKSMGVHFRSLSENIDTTSAAGELVFHIIGAMAQFERNLISERTKAGLSAARARGKVGGRKQKLSDSDIAKAKAMTSDKSVSISEIAKHFGISRPTLYKYIS